MQNYSELGFNGVVDSTIPGSLAYGGEPALMPALYPGAFNGGVGTGDSVQQQFGAASTAAGSGAVAYGAATGSKRFYDQPAFWGIFLFALGVWLLAHMALVESKL